MSQASVNITQQFLDGQVVPAQLVGQDAASKRYVDEQLAIRDADIAAAAGAASAAQADIDAHEASTTAHPAQNITYTGLVAGAANVKQGLDNLYTRVNDIIADGDSSAEVVDARGGYPVLGDRLNDFDEQLADIATNVDGRGINVKAPPYNAKGNGVDDDTAAFQAAINYCATNRIPLIVPGSADSYVLGDLTIPSYVNIIGMGGNRVKIKAKPNTVSLFKIQGREISIENLFIDMNAVTDTNSTAFLFDTSAAYGIYDIKIKSIRVWNAYCAFNDSNASNNYVNTFIEDVICAYPKGTQIIVNDSQGFNFYTKVSVDMTLNTSPVTFPAWSLRNTAGLILQDCDALGHGTGTAFNAGATGFELINCTAVWFNRVMVDFIGGIGVKITGSNYIYLNDLVTSLCLGGGLDISASNYITGSNVRTGGTKGQVYETVGKYGIRLEGVNTFNISAIYTYNNTDDGLYFKDCSRLQVGVLQSNDNSGFGIKEEETAVGTSVANIISSAITAGNTEGNAQLVSSFTYISAIIINAGTAQFQEVGPITI